MNIIKKIIPCMILIVINSICHCESRIVKEKKINAKSLEFVLKHQKDYMDFFIDDYFFDLIILPDKIQKYKKSDLFKIYLFCCSKKNDKVFHITDMVVNNKIIKIDKQIKELKMTKSYDNIFFTGYEYFEYSTILATISDDELHDDFSIILSVSDGKKNNRLYYSFVVRKRSFLSEFFDYL